MIKNLKNKLKRHLEEVLEIKTSPHSVAAGFALGTLIAISPTFGLGAFIGLGVILIFKKISKISMLVSFAIWNPFVLASLYPLDYAIGNIVLRNVSVKTYRVELFNQLFVHSRRFLVGSVILAVTISLLSYLIVLILINYYQQKKLKSVNEELKKVKEVLNPL